MRGLWNCNVLCISTPFKLMILSYVLISIPLICHAIILVAHQYHALIVVIRFRCLLLHDRTRVWDWVDNTEDQYLSINVLFKKKNSEDLFLFLVINEQGKHMILCFQSTSILAKYCIRFKCLLSVVRVILSYACSCRLNSPIHCS
jgi:hypothetical protein